MLLELHPWLLVHCTAQMGQAKVEDLQEERVEAMERHVKVLQEL